MLYKRIKMQLLNKGKLGYEVAEYMGIRIQRFYSTLKNGPHRFMYWELAKMKILLNLTDEEFLSWFPKDEKEFQEWFGESGVGSPKRKAKKERKEA